MPEKSLRGIHFLLFLSAGVFLAGIWWGLPSFFGWAPDELIPSRVFNGLAKAYSNGWYDKYPPFHYYVLSVFHLPFWLLDRLRLLDVHALPVYTLLFYLTRLVSTVMALAIVYLIYRCGRELYEEKASLFAGLIASLLVPLVYYSKTANLDVPYLFWLVWSLYFFIRAFKSLETRHFLLFSTTAVLAICTKDLAYAFYVPAPFLLIWADWRNKRESGSRRSFLGLIGSRKYPLSAAIAAAVFALVHNLLFNWSGFVRHVREIIGPASKPYQQFPNSLVGQAALLKETVGQIGESFGWPIFIICIGGVVWSLLPKKRSPLLLALLALAVSQYVFFISIIRFNFARFNLSICLVLSFFGGRLIADWLTQRRRLLAIRRSLVAAIFLYTFLYSSSVDMLMIKDSRYTSERWIKANVPRQALIGVTCPIQYSPRLPGFNWKTVASTPEILADAAAPEYLIVNQDYVRTRRFPKTDKFFTFFSSRSIRKGGFALADTQKELPAWNFLRTRFVMTQINIINPEIKIYKRIKK